VCGVDLNDAETQRLVKRYFEDHKPFVAVMAPTCTPYGRMAYQNFVHNFDGWKRSWDNAHPHARFCGRIALLQLRSGRHFLREQPFPTLMDEEPPWPEVIAHPSVIRVVVDQCRFNQVLNGLPVKKPTEILTSAEDLAKPFRDKRCLGCPAHASLEGGQGDKAKLWSWEFSQAVVNGICTLLRKQTWRPNTGQWHVDASVEQMFDWTLDDWATMAFPAEVADKTADISKCPGCRGQQGKHDPRHTRVPGECRWPFTVTIEWSCPACQARLPFRSGDKKFVYVFPKMLSIQFEILILRSLAAPWPLYGLGRF
jgi:hypothetical protein